MSLLWLASAGCAEVEPRLASAHQAGEVSPPRPAAEVFDARARTEEAPSPARSGPPRAAVIRSSAATRGALAAAYIRAARSPSSVPFQALLRARLPVRDAMGDVSDEVPTPGLPPLELGALRLSSDARTAALELDRDSLIVDAVSGRPLGLVLGDQLLPGQNIDDVWVGREGVYDRVGTPLIEGHVLTVHNGRAHLLRYDGDDQADDDGRVRAHHLTFRLDRRQLERESTRWASAREHAAGPAAFHPTALGAVSPFGVWSAESDRFAAFDDVDVSAVREDGRYRVAIRCVPMTHHCKLAITDLARGSTRWVPLVSTGLVNGGPFTFLTDDKVAIHDYTRWQIDLRTGNIDRTCGIRDDCIDDTSPWAAPARPEPVIQPEVAGPLMRRIEAETCHVGDLVLPGELCR